MGGDHLMKNKVPKKTAPSPIQNSSGSSLLIVMILPVIAGAIGFLMPLLMKSGNQAIKMSRDQVNFNQLVSMVQLVLSSPKDCKDAFTGVKYNPNVSGYDSSNDVPQIMLNGYKILATTEDYNGLKIGKMYFFNDNEDYFSGVVGPVDTDSVGTKGPLNPYLPQTVATMPAGTFPSPLNAEVIDVTGYLIPMPPVVIKYSYVTWLHIEAEKSTFSHGQRTLTADLPVRITTVATFASDLIDDCLGINFTSTTSLLLTTNPPHAPTPFPWPWLTRSMCMNSDLPNSPDVTTVQTYFYSTLDSNPDWQTPSLIPGVVGAYQALCSFEPPL